MEKKVLKIQEYLRKNGLAKAIQEFKLKTRIYGHKVLLKYDQLESPMSFDEVKECRGLILSKDNWDILCYSFFKFFNHGESQAAKIDWNTAVVLEKLDGTMIQVYWDWHKNEWFAATTGTAEGEGEVNNKMGTTFNELFWNTLDKVSPIARNSFNFFKGFTFVFELTTPYNIVVKPHGESSITLLAARDNRTLEEIPYDKLARAAESFQVPLVKAFDLNAKDFGALIKTFEGMPWSEEGYVVVDANFNRVKIKNPAYVAVHHLKSKTAEHNILTVVKSNEIEEFAATFPERREEIFKLKANYDALIAKLNEAWVELEPRKPKNITPAERKNYATAVFEVTKKYGLDSFTGLYFALQTGKIDTIKEYMMEYDDKKLYKML
jgi:T4 RnlA family RNA ligase